MRTLGNFEIDNETKEKLRANLVNFDILHKEIAKEDELFNNGKWNDAKWLELQHQLDKLYREVFHKVNWIVEQPKDYEV